MADNNNSKLLSSWTNCKEFCRDWAPYHHHHQQLLNSNNNNRLSNKHHQQRLRIMHHQLQLQLQLRQQQPRRVRTISNNNNKVRMTFFDDWDMLDSLCDPFRGVNTLFSVCLCASFWYLLFPPLCSVCICVCVAAVHRQHAEMWHQSSQSFQFANIETIVDRQ